MIIAITRIAEKSSDDIDLLQRYGHECRIVSPIQAKLFTNVVQQFVIAANDNEFDAIFFTSAYPAKIIGPQLSDSVIDNTRIIAIGPQTAKILKKTGINTVEMLNSFYSKDFVPYLGEWIRDKTIGIPRAANPNPELIKSIESSGGLVFEYKCYSLDPTHNPIDLTGVDAIIFTSSSSYRFSEFSSGLGSTIPIAIGTVTANTMRENGVNPVVVGDGSLEGTLNRLNTFINNNGPGGI
ncbi:MAG TPA: uroporphyrinogen-III synthase [Methanocorpusculum sp.]|nr:uroporphyrinogen-III synthase [Methanocorpusculum sp.]